MNDLPASPPAVRQRPDLDRIAFDLVLLAFLAVVVYSAFGLRPDSRLVPLLIGVPTLAAMVVRTVLDITRHGKEYRTITPGTPAGQDGSGPDAADMASASIMDLARAAQEEVEADDEAPADEMSRRRQGLFALWCFGFVGAAVAGTALLPPIFGLHTYLLPAGVTALVLIFRLIGLGWLKNIAITAVVIGSMYYMLVAILNVRL